MLRTQLLRTKMCKLDFQESSCQLIYLSKNNLYVHYKYIYMLLFWCAVFLLFISFEEQTKGKEIEQTWKGVVNKIGEKYLSHAHVPLRGAFKWVSSPCREREIIWNEISCWGKITIVSGHSCHHDLIIKFLNRMNKIYT